MANIARTAETEALAGLVERVAFHNPNNGFCVLRIKARGQRELITVVATCGMTTAGGAVRLGHGLDEHRRIGSHPNRLRNSTWTQDQRLSGRKAWKGLRIQVMRGENVSLNG